MCGIIGYTGKNDAEEILLNALELLEYRGYDSAGIAVDGPEGVKIVKCAGRVAKLREACGRERAAGCCGIGHTRWATHGGVSDRNSHPHRCGRVTVVHNGIFENYKELVKCFGLEEKLLSETDSEAAAAVLDYYYTDSPEEAIKKTVSCLKGTYALVMLFEGAPGAVYAVRSVSPIVAAVCGEGAMLASDVTALCRFTNRYFVVPEQAVLRLDENGARVTAFSGEELRTELLTADWELNCSDKGGYPFYMEKEIMEQPEAIRNTVNGRIRDGLPDFDADGVPDSLFTECERLCVVACGTALHAGLVCQALVKQVLRMPMDVECASEFIYGNPVIDEKTLVIAVSQSGETVDTLEALKFARRAGAKSLAVLNVRGSSIALESDYALYTNAGPEIAVASTKAYTTQLAVFYLLVARMAYVKEAFDEDETRSFIRELLRVPEALEKVLAGRRDIHKIAGQVLEAKDLFMIGRGLDYSILLEGSLKLKEVSYIHSEAYASGELKHGPIALITEKTPVIAVATQEKLKRKETSNIQEVRARGASVILFLKEGMEEEGLRDLQTVTLPAMRDEFMVMPASVALQLLAYYVSYDKGFDVDKPRNLAKVVTVE